MIALDENQLIGYLQCVNKARSTWMATAAEVITASEDSRDKAVLISTQALNAYNDACRELALIVQRLTERALNSAIDQN